MKGIDNQSNKKKISSEMLKSIKELAARADREASRSVEQEFPFDQELSDEDKETIDIIKDTQNPQVSYKLFYAIQGLMIQFLPKGQQYKGLREYAYELKNILLTQGKNKNERGIRGGDARQAFIAAELKIMYDVITDWVKNGAMAAYLIERLQALNEERGYDYPGNPRRRDD
jgi:hypothetical protein